MDLNHFLHSRRPRWDRLRRLLDKVDRISVGGLSPQETDELFSLYRLVSSDLNLVQTRTANPVLLEFLEKLVGRAYANLAVPRRSSFFRSWWRTLRHGFPTAIRKELRLLLLSAITMGGGLALGFITTFTSPDAADVFLPPEHLAQSPSQRVAELEELERSGRTRVDSLSVQTLFTTFLFTHNIRVTVLCFALGFTFGVGTLVLLFFNGAMLGSLAALYVQDGVLEFFIAWVGPHGAIELPCILFGSTAGLMIARAQFRRDLGSTASQVRALRPTLVSILVGTSTLLVVSGAIEGGFSQVNEPTLPYPFKIVVAGGMFLSLLAYLFWMPARDARPEEDQGLAVQS